MQDAEADWDSRSLILTWEEATRLDGWSIGRQTRDEVSAGFWLIHAPAPLHVEDGNGGER